MPSNMDNNLRAHSIETMRSFRITSLDDEEEEVELSERPVFNDGCDDFDDDENEELQVPVALGFVGKSQHRWSLLRQLFPSKAGGVPAWLDPINLPCGKSCHCDICGEPLQFLLQVYAPLIEKESAFHRTLFVVMCPSMTCLLQDQHEQWKRQPEKQLRSVKVFRCQLPLTNNFYSSKPPRHDGTDKPSGLGAALCNWCGTWKGDKVCGSCRKVRYCSNKHQAIHWHSGHKADCQQMSMSYESSKSSSIVNTALWPEYEILVEDECDYDTEMPEGDNFAKSLLSGSRMDETIQSGLDGFEGDDERRSWASFQERIGKAPEQILRHCRAAGARPLWPMSSGRPSRGDIPNCRYCGGLLGFEFQILPQLLFYFGVKNDRDSLDWSTIVVYTCQASCEGGVAYKEEFAWIQIPSQSAPSL